MAEVTTTVLADLQALVSDAEQDAHDAAQVGGYVPLDDEIDAPVTWGMVRRWIEQLEPPPEDIGTKDADENEAEIVRSAVTMIAVLTDALQSMPGERTEIDAQLLGFHASAPQMLVSINFPDSEPRVYSIQVDDMTALTRHAVAPRKLNG